MYAIIICGCLKLKYIWSFFLQMARLLGVDGVVIGVLLPDFSIDFDTIDKLVDIAKNESKNIYKRKYLTSIEQESNNLLNKRPAAAAAAPMKVTFHRAFDVCINDPIEAISALQAHKIDYLLTSGKARFINS